ncbi:hypothetical protein ACQ4PT_050673 [Festuca glaucescens]
MPEVNRDNNDQLNTRHSVLVSGGAGGSAGKAATETIDSSIHPNNNSARSTDQDAATGETISSEDSDLGSDDEVQSTPSSQTILQTPYPNMKFDSWEEARMHYNKYAKHVGFSIKSSTSRNSIVDKLKEKYLFVCTRSGKTEDINKQEVPPMRHRICSFTRKTDCRARLRVKRAGAKWNVTMFIAEHNHPLVKKWSLKRYLRSHRKIPKEEKHFVKIWHKVNLSAGRVMQIMSEIYGGTQNVPYIKKDISNYMANLGDEHVHTDMYLLMEKFAEIKKEDPDFYSKIHLDHDERVEMIFWVDGAARKAYKDYHDCLSFGTTYMTNWYNMPFAPFIGINRYGQSIQLGCGFLRNEKIKNLVWLFKSFLEAMGGVQPENFITDQDVAMARAIVKVFVDCCHRNCRWHIIQNVQGPLGNTKAKNESLRLELNETIDYSVTVDEFETRWAEMLLKHNVADNTHLADLYDLRQCFVLVYFKDRFFLFLQTTVRSEGFNVVLKRYVNPHNSFVHFFNQYQKVQENIDVAKDANEFDTGEREVRLWGDYPLEEQALVVYTRPIYLRFRVELRKNTTYNVQQLNADIYDIIPIRGSVFGYGRRSYKVEADLSNSVYSCECSKFKRDGILCCHIVRVMAHTGMTDYIPDHYLLPRWLTPVEEPLGTPIEVPEVPTDRKLSMKEKKVIRYGNLCNDFMKLAEIACCLDKSNTIANKHMQALESELKALKLESSKKKKGKKEVEATETITMTVDGVETTETQKVKNPPKTTTKGRPEKKRRARGLVFMLILQFL